jgi:hypothetical protein
VTPGEAGGIERKLEREGRQRWRSTRGRAPEPTLRAERKGRRYEVTVSSGGRSATLGLSERFVMELVSSATGAACADCADRFFDKLFDRLLGSE